MGLCKDSHTCEKHFFPGGEPVKNGYMELLASDPYADAVAHKHAGDKETLLIPVTAGTPVIPRTAAVKN